MDLKQLAIKQYRETQSVNRKLSKIMENLGIEDTPDLEPINPAQARAMAAAMAANPALTAKTTSREKK